MKSNMTAVVRLHDSAITFLNHAQSPLLLLVRLYWGYQFAQSGWGRLHHVVNAADFFASLGFPQPYLTVIIVSVIEFAGGILFAIGLGSRIVSLVLFLDMNVAYWTADREALGDIFNDPGKFYNANPYTFWFASLLILVFGAGYFVLDTIVNRSFQSTK